MIKLIQGDITELEVDAIVNPANSRLIMGGGVAGAIKAKGGNSIQDECNKIGSTTVGAAVITSGGQLKAKYVIHAVGPRRDEQDADGKLRNATMNSLKIAQDKEIGSIAFPAISTGIFGYPVDKCARIMLSATHFFLITAELPEEVIFCLFDDKVFKVFEEELKQYETDEQPAE